MNVIHHSFLYIYNMSIAAAYAGIVVILARFVFRPFSKKYVGMLWLAPAFRMICPISLAGSLSILFWFPISMQDYYPVGEGNLAVLSRLRFVCETSAEYGVIGKAMGYLWAGGIVLLILFHLSRFLKGKLRHINDSSVYTQRERWIKGFALCLLTIHWLNPIIWLCYYLMCHDMKAQDVERHISPWKDKALWGLAALLVILCCLNPFNNVENLRRENILEIKSGSGLLEWEEAAGNAELAEDLIHIINTAHRTPTTEEDKSVSWYGDQETLFQITSMDPQTKKSVVYRFVRFNAKNYSILYGEMETGIALYRKEAGSTEKCYVLPYEIRTEVFR